MTADGDLREVVAEVVDIVAPRPEPVTEIVKSAPATSKVVPRTNSHDRDCPICDGNPCRCPALANEIETEAKIAIGKRILPRRGIKRLPAAGHEWAPVTYTRFECNDEHTASIVRKRATLADDRSLVLKPAEKPFWNGRAILEQRTLGEFGQELQATPPSKTHAFYTAGVSSECEPGKPLQMGKLKTGEKRSRSKEGFPFPEVNALLAIDSDSIHEWPEIQTSEDLVDIIAQLDPALDADCVTSSSGSSFLVGPREKRGLRGLHTFYTIDKGAEIPRVLEALHVRAWLNGYGRILVTKNGRMEPRSIFDTALVTPNQPIYEFGAVLQHEAVKQNRQVKPYLSLSGKKRVLADNVAPLTDEERAEYARLVEAAKAEKRPEADRVTSEWLTLQTKALPPEKQEAARAALIAQRENKYRDLSPDFPITVDNGRVLLVKELLDQIKANPDAWHKKTIPDPFEPDYGTTNATIFAKDQHDGRVRVLSFAHGGVGDGRPVVYFLDEKPRPVQSLSPGSLVRITDNGRIRLVASQAREQMLPALRGRYAQAVGAKVWHTWDGHHWRPEGDDSEVSKALHDLIEIGCDDLGFNGAYVRSVREILEMGGNLVLPEPMDRHAIPFRNGVLVPGTKAFHPVDPGNGNIWCLPYEYAPAATCPRIYAFLRSAMGGDVEMVEYLRAVLAAILHGRADLQVFFYLIGPGGSGKSTFLRLAQALVGKHNTHTTDLKTLEGDAGRFETACCYGKRLLLLNDLDKWGGGLARLKALTGQDPLRYEEKHKQQKSGSGFIYEGMVLSASNEPLVSTDLTSGVIRRQRNVEFSCVVSEEEKSRWKTMGGEGVVLHSEMPGLVNWLLGLSPDMIESLINNPPARAKRSNFEAMLENNRVARWLVWNCAPEPGHHAVVGGAKAHREGGTVRYENAHEHLYPSFLAFCAEEGVQTLSRGRFMSTIEDIARTLKHPVLQKQKPGANVKSFRDLRLLGEYEERYRWDDSIDDDELKAVPDPFDTCE